MPTTIIPSATDANTLHTELIKGVDFSIPAIDFTKPPFDYKPDPDSPIFKEPERISNESLTQKKYGGTGTFDVIMESVHMHLKVEYDKGRISGNDYAQAWVALTEASMTNAVEFALQKETAYWNALATQSQVQVGVINYEIAKMQLAHQRISSHTEEARYASAKMDAVNLESSYVTSEYNLKEILPIQKEGMINSNDLSKYELTDMSPSKKDLLIAQKDGQLESNKLLEHELTKTVVLKDSILSKEALSIDAKTSIDIYNLSDMLPSQKDLVDAQTRIQGINYTTAEYNLSKILPAQLTLVLEQGESQRAQTLDTRSDNQMVKGSIGKQKELYTQQITSYKRDAEYKVGKFYVDAFITMKTIDEGLLPPDNFKNTSIDSVLTKIKTNNEL